MNAENVIAFGIDGKSVIAFGIDGKSDIAFGKDGVAAVKEQTELLRSAPISRISATSGRAPES